METSFHPIYNMCTMNNKSAYHIHKTNIPNFLYVISSYIEVSNYGKIICKLIRNFQTNRHLYTHKEGGVSLLA